MRDVRADFGAELREFNGAPDHVRLLANFPPTLTTSRLVNSLKGVSSPQAAAGVPGTARPLLAGHAAVVRVLLAGSVGSPITAVRQYIEQQHRPS